MTAGVVRVGNTVRRPIKPDAIDLSALLSHFETAGLDGTPHFLGNDEKGRAILSYLEGEVPTDLGHYSDAQLVAAATLLRRFHDASSNFAPVVAAGAEVLCHNDFGPPNAVFRNLMPIGLIDFDTAAPGSRLWDLSHSAVSWLDLGDDFYSGPEQIRRLRHFVSAYGHPACTTELVAVHAVTRLVRLEALGKVIGDDGMRDWAHSAALWTTTNVVEPLHPSGL